MDPKTFPSNQKYSMSFPNTILPLGRVHQYRNDLQTSCHCLKKLFQDWLYTNYKRFSSFKQNLHHFLEAIEHTIEVIDVEIFPNGNVPTVTSQFRINSFYHLRA